MYNSIIINDAELIGISQYYRFQSSDINQSKSTSYLESINYNFYNPSFVNNYLFINNVLSNDIEEDTRLVDITSVSEYNDDNISIDIDTQLPLFFVNKALIKVPKKIAFALSRHTPKHLLYAIHSDLNVAIELCLIFTTQLTSTYFEVVSGENPDGWKSLRAEYLRDLICINSSAYKDIVTALEYPLSKGQILECDHIRIVGKRNFHYRLGTAYIGKGIIGYELKTKDAIRVLNKHYNRMLSTSIQNPICQNLIRIYSDVTLPTIDQINKEAKRLIKFDGGYVTKKGKKLTFLNKHSKSYFKDADKRSFVEDAIEIFQYLTDNGLMIPSKGSEKSGGRIVDSFTLMPSWIRRLVKINGKTLSECDYSALHPNIAIKLYGGDMKFIKHGDLANDLKMDVTDVKTEHLSFFNKNVWSMKQSPLYGYYMEKEPIMLHEIINEKMLSEYKHKVTSRRMFRLEVDIMNDVIQQLNNESIYVLYVYDALLCLPKQSERVLLIMNSTILKHGVHTEAKCTKGTKFNPLVEALKETTLDKKTIEFLMPKTQIKKLKESNTLCVDASQISFSIRMKELVLEKINQGKTIEFTDAIIKFEDGYTYKDRILAIKDDFNPSHKYITYSHIYGKRLVA